MKTVPDLKYATAEANAFPRIPAFKNVTAAAPALKMDVDLRSPMRGARKKGAAMR